MDDAYWYHPVAMHYRGSHTALARVRTRHATWRAAWEALSPTERPDPDREAQRLSESGINLLVLHSSEYPALLQEISYAPFGIYVRGTLPEPSAPHMAIVGTRKATPEGTRTARVFARALAERGCPIVSGLALGVDAAAHEGALESHGTTVAVLGNGVDAPHPKTNARLADRILLSHGALVSEYPPGTPALPHHFLERNRIVSGVTRGTLVIEAPERSGSLATARFALEQNRNVYVVPGPIRHPHFAGSHALIKKGATLVTDPADILEDLGIATASSHTLTPEEALILQTLKNTSHPLSLDSIIEITHLEARCASTATTMLVLAKTIIETDTGYTVP